MTSTRSPGSRGPLIAVTLAAAVVLVAALAWQAASAARAQRDVAEGVLRDYATLAAEQYVRNIAVTFEYEWFYPTLQLAAAPDTFLAAETRRTASDASRPPPDDGARTATGGDSSPRVPLTASAEAHPRSDRPAGLTEPSPLDPNLLLRGQRDEYRLGELATALFALDGLGELAVRTIGEHDPGDTFWVSDSVRLHLERHYEDGWSSAAFLHPSEPGRLVAYRRAEDGGVIGFVAEATMLERFLADAVTVYELLPPSLTARATAAGEDDLVGVRVEDDRDTELFRHGPAGAPAVEAAFDLEPRLADLRVIASIPASSAGHLVVGGLPYSRLPLIAGMLGVTLGLLALSVLMWRRERELIDLREQFVAGASHELRTPLTQIRMFAETLRLDRVRSVEERDRSLEIIDREARRLSLLVDNLLQFSHPASLSSRFAPEPVELAPLIEDVVDGFRPLAAAQQARLEVRVDGAPVVTADRDMIRQVLVNLLDNAVKYGPATQTISVELADDAATVRIRVTDQGPGIPVAERDLVWQRFWRGPRANGITGTGIGLALVRELVELHGGSVAVADAEGGARFEVRLPKDNA